MLTEMLRIFKEFNLQNYRRLGIFVTDRKGGHKKAEPKSFKRYFKI